LVAVGVVVGVAGALLEAAARVAVQGALLEAAAVGEVA
jgi:hypothetical protein